MKNDDKIKYWIEISIDVLDSAEIMLEKNKLLQSGFYCHQSAEKMLKAYYCLSKKNDPPYTHNLIKLSKESGLDNLMDERFKNLIDLLMPLNIEARYPDEKISILKTLNYSRSDSIYKETGEFIRWIQTLIIQ